MRLVKGTCKTTSINVDLSALADATKTVIGESMMGRTEITISSVVNLGLRLLANRNLESTNPTQALHYLEEMGLFKKRTGSMHEATLMQYEVVKKGHSMDMDEAVAEGIRLSEAKNGPMKDVLSTKDTRPKVEKPLSQRFAEFAQGFGDVPESIIGDEDTLGSLWHWTRHNAFSHGKSMMETIETYVERVEQSDSLHAKTLWSQTHAWLLQWLERSSGNPKDSERALQVERTL